jgi:type IV pilus assembly protein PilQ
VSDPVVNLQEQVIDSSGNVALSDKLDSSGRPMYGLSLDPTAEQVLRPVYDKKGRLKYVPDSSQYQQPDNSFYSYLEAQIQSRSAKILAQPTLLVKEGQTSAVKTGLEVVVNIDADGSYEKETAGLTLTVGVDRIDDNGFVTMNIFPKLGFPILAGEQGGIPFYNIDTRELKADGIRLRDGQTLIVSGVISEQQSEEIKKWPILGDMPIIGSLFRASKSVRNKEELVVVVTPQVLDDEQGGVYGYGYTPGTSGVQNVLNLGR